MNIAVIGGGRQCIKLMDLIESFSFNGISPHVVALADVRSDAPGFLKAKEQGIFVTNNYHDFFVRDDIELIMELTGNEDIFNDILMKKQKSVRLIGHRSAMLFWEIARVSALEKETSQQLKETRIKYDVIINQLIDETVMVIDADYRIMDINITLLKKYNVRRENAIGRYCYELLHGKTNPCADDRIPCPVVKACGNRKSTAVTQVVSDHENRESYLSCSCYPLIESGQVVGAINITKDITKEINLQKMMMQQEKLASIGRLSAGVAHEINNPLTTILTSTLLLQEDFGENDPIYRELQTVADEALRCRKIVASLLDFARQTRPTRKLTDLNDVVIRSCMLTKKLAAFNDVDIQLELDETLVEAYVDKGQIEQSLINLVLNAIEATEPGGKIRLSTRLNRESGEIEIAISDTGIGIPSGYLDKIFDPFFTTTENGTGLGLAVTHGLIEQHGGCIDVDSTPGRGTCFTIKLKIDQEK
jgi:two-component system, NtrC family, sensor kinase